MKIKEIVVFAYATKGEALEVANSTALPSCVAAVHIMRGLESAPVPVAFMVVPEIFGETDE